MKYNNKCCENMELLPIIKNNKSWLYIFIYVREYEKRYVCKNCGKVFR